LFATAYYQIKRVFKLHNSGKSKNEFKFIKYPKSFYVKVWIFSVLGCQGYIYENFYKPSGIKTYFVIYDQNNHSRKNVILDNPLKKLIFTCLDKN